MTLWLVTLVSWTDYVSQKQLFNESTWIVVYMSNNWFYFSSSRLKVQLKAWAGRYSLYKLKVTKEAAGLLLQKYSVITEPLKVGLKKLESVQVDHNSVNFCCNKMKNTHLVPDEALFWHLPITHSQNSQGLLMHL